MATSQLLVLLWTVSSLYLTSGFLSTRPSPLQTPTRRHQPVLQTAVVDELISELEKKDKENDNIKDLIGRLPPWNATTTTTSDDHQQQRPDFNALIGYYNVSATVTASSTDKKKMGNAVGGKWTQFGSSQLLTIERTLQHVLPLDSTNNVPNHKRAVAQAVNVIRLRLCFGLIPMWIILRGDAVPLSQDNVPNETAGDSKKKTKSPPRLLPGLSPLAVRVYFDKPRISIGKLVLQFGPTSTVVLDTPYCDDQLRIGRGGTSGALFCFRRVNDAVAKEGWQWVMDASSASLLTQRRAFLGTLLTGVLSSITARLTCGVTRSLAVVAAALSGVGVIFIASSTGGIETRSDTYYSSGEP